MSMPIVGPFLPLAKPPVRPAPPRPKVDTVEHQDARIAAKFAELLKLTNKSHEDASADATSTSANSVESRDPSLSAEDTGDDDTNAAIDAARYGLLTEPAAGDTPTPASAAVDDAAARAAANALALALAQSAANVNLPVTTVDGLDPTFRDRLDRVIARMKELGHNVTLVETVRSQDRQDQLYAQGRTTPGAVVTWTGDSAHTRGEAADLLVDGSWTNAQGFQRLQTIAKQEGLVTLGDRDAGHVELPKGEGTSASLLQTAARRAAADGAAEASGVARVASVAQVASVGNTAAMAATLNVSAPVANPAARTAAARSASAARSAAAALAEPAAAVTSDTGETGVRTPLAAPASPAGESPDARAASSQQDRNRDGAAREERDLKEVGPDRGGAAAADDWSRTNARPFVGPTDPVEHPVPQVDAVQRLQDIDALRDAAASRPLSQITLQVDGPNGEAQRITVDLRGNAVGTHISADPASADLMRTQVGELHSALESRGLTVDTVRISAAGTRALDAVDGATHLSAVGHDAMRLTGGTTAGPGDGSPQQGPRDRSTATRDWEERQAAREEQRRGTRQQDRQRPGYQEKP